MNFGLVVNNPVAHLPSVPFSNLRLWDTQVTWADIATAPGVFNWTNLDAQLVAAAKANKSVLYTFGKVPAWANNSQNSAVPPGGMVTGNLRWKYFVANLVLHSLVSPAPIAAYEVWNEPNLSQYWAGTQTQLIQMAKDAAMIIKGLHEAFNIPVTIVGPACDGGTLVKGWLTDYYKLGGPGDVLNFHGYLDDYKPIPSSLNGLLNDINAKKADGLLPKQPVWFTEGSWGEMSNYATPLTSDQQTVYLAQMYVTMFSAGVDLFDWYAWDNTSGWGQLWTAAGPNQAGIAYGVLAGWLSGALLTQPATANANGTMSLGMAMPKGIPAQIVWHPTQTHSLATSAMSYSSLDGKTFPVQKGSVTVGPKPILLI
jgi:hypothetical protein